MLAVVLFTYLSVCFLVPAHLWSIQYIVSGGAKWAAEVLNWDVHQHFELNDRKQWHYIISLKEYKIWLCQMQPAFHSSKFPTFLSFTFDVTHLIRDNDSQPHSLSQMPSSSDILSNVSALWSHSLSTLWLLLALSCPPGAHTSTDI